MHYFGTRLSENISRRDPEGYLLCLNVPVARSGTQEYLPEELGLPEEHFSKLPERNAANLPSVTGTNANSTCHSERSRGISFIPVNRPPSEVFSPATIASFEGMPVTNDHPPESVDIANIHSLQMGHAHNVRRGTGDESDLLLADLIITDPRLIDLILSGKREISCGYTYELCLENGQYIQRRIRGNHIAVVDAGRAGPRVSIKDERSKRTTMKKSLTKLLARMAKDGDAETVAEFIEEMIEEKENTPGEVLEAPSEPNAEDPAPETPVTVEVPENREITIDNDLFAGVLERLDKLIALLTLPEPAADSDLSEEVAEVIEEVLESAEAAREDPAENLAEQVSEAVESILEPASSATLEENADECSEPETLETKDTLRAVLKAVRPALARMTPSQRQRVCGDIAANLRKSRKTGDSRVYASLASARKPKPDHKDLGKKIMEKRNPCYKG